MSLDEVLDELGAIGKYQMLIFIAINLCQWPWYWDGSIIFTGYYFKHHCKSSPNMTLEESVPYTIKNNQTVWSQCEMYQNLSVDNSTTPCTNGWQYYHQSDEPTSSIVSEWDLVCDKSTYVAQMWLISVVGFPLGNFFWSPISDKYGRKKPLFISAFLSATVNLAIAFSPNYWVYVVLQTVERFVCGGLFAPAFIIGSEMFPARLRGFTVPLNQLMNSLGGLFLPLIALLLRDWRHITIATAAVGYIPLAYYFWCPESIRWLLANGKNEETLNILRKAEKFNRKKIDPVVLKKMLQESKEELENVKREKAERQEQHLERRAKLSDPDASFWIYMTQRKTFMYMTLMIFMIFSDEMVARSVNLLLGDLPGNVYVNYFLHGLLEIPGVILSVVCMHFVSRRWSLVVFHVCGAIFMSLAVLTTYLDPGFKTLAGLQTTMVFLSRINIFGAYSIIGVFIQEIFPTNLRTTGFGIVASIGLATANLAAPYVVPLYRINQQAALLILAGLGFATGFLSLLEPETKGRELPTTIKEILDWPRSLSKEEKKALQGSWKMSISHCLGKDKPVALDAEEMVTLTQQ